MPENIKFIRIKNPSILSNPNEIKNIQKLNSDQYLPDYTIKCVRRSTIKKDDNWKLYLLDPQQKSKDLLKLSILEDISIVLNEPKRGKAGDRGRHASAIIFINSRGNPLGNLANQIPNKFIGFGMRVNKLYSGNRRKVILTDNCLNQQQALHIPNKYSGSNGLEPIIAQKNPGLDNYFNQASQISNKWRDIVNDLYNGKVKPLIIIPRGDRKKHIVFFNPFFKSKDIVLSTNFIYFTELQKKRNDINQVNQLKFITGYLNSTFGQIQFEISCGDQEGNRKLNEDKVKEFKIPDPTKIDKKFISKIANKLEDFNNIDVDVIGTEPISNNPRRNLDKSIAEMIFYYDKLGFSSVEDMVDYFELFLEELVIDRRS